MEPSPSPTASQIPLQNSFPSPPPTSVSQLAPSVASSRVTDLASEDGDKLQRQRQAISLKPNAAASVDPNCPGSTASSQTRPSMRTLPSRNGMSSPSTTVSWRPGGTFGGSGDSMMNTSRPPSANSRTSRTHAPSLASHAFFRPMSSQRLQAQRGFRPVKVEQPSAGFDEYSEAGTNSIRYSLVSYATPHQSHQIQHHTDMPLPLREIEFMQQDERGTVNASPTDNTTLRSMADSERPLQIYSTHPRPMQSDIDRRSDESPKSFRANLHRATTIRKEIQGHKRLSSLNNSPTSAKKLPEAVSKAGINYQYFSGNTIFCWGGRFQNTRDRPINVVSGLIVVLPTILFLLYS